MKVLFVTRIIEHPAAGGAQLRIENSIKALNRVCELHIISMANQANIGGIKAEMFYRSYCKEFAYSPSVTQLHENRCIRGLQMLYSFAIAKDYIDIDARYILKTVNNNKIDLVWVGYGNISFPLIRKKPLPEICPAPARNGDLLDLVNLKAIANGLPHYVHTHPLVDIAKPFPENPANV